MAKKKSNSSGVKFIRKRGRIIPIRTILSSKDQRAGKDIFSRKNAPQLATIGAAGAASYAGLFTAGKMQRFSNALEGAKKFGKAAKINRAAKILKFGSKAVPGIFAGSALLSIDRKSRDEGTIFDIGNKSGAVNMTTSLALGYAAIRTGKRFEKWGLRGGKFPIKLKDI